MKTYSTLALICALFFTTACQSTATETAQTTTTNTSTAKDFNMLVNEEAAQIQKYKNSDAYKKELRKQMELWQDISLHMQQHYRSKLENQHTKPFVNRLERHENSIGDMWSELTFLEENEANLHKLENDHYLKRFIKHHKQTTKILTDIKRQLGI